MSDVSLIVGTTLADWAEDIADNVTDRNAYFRHLKGLDKASPNGRKGYVVKRGGERFKETLFAAVNSTFKGYDSRETVDTTAGNPIKEAEYEIKIIAGSINISLLEEAQNTEKYQIHDLALVKKEEAEYSMGEQIGAAVLSDGTTDTKLPGGLQQLIATTNTTVGTIDSAANAFWRPQRDTSGVSAWNTSDEGLIAFEQMWGLCKRDPLEPDVIVTTVAVGTLINIMQIKNHSININNGANKADLGFGAVHFHGAPVLSDDNVPAGYLYLVNSRFTRFQVLSKGNFALTKMKQPVGGLYSVAQLYLFANMTCGARRLNGVMTAITG